MRNRKIESIYVSEEVSYVEKLKRTTKISVRVDGYKAQNSNSRPAELIAANIVMFAPYEVRLD
jgi:hypothetical protein